MTLPLRLLPVLLVSGLSLAAQAAGEPAASGVLTLNNGDAVPGEFVASDAADAVRWQAAAFTEPFEFVPAALAAIRFPAAQPPVKPQGEFAVELAGGDLLTGRLTSWSDDRLTLDSLRFGAIALRREAVRRVYRIDANPMLVYAGPSGLTGWKTGSPPWQEDGPFVWTDKDHSTLTADLGVPDRAVIEFEISWTRTPDFALALGVDPNALGDSRLDGWRFETWATRSAIQTVRKAEPVRGNVILLPNGRPQANTGVRPPASAAETEIVLAVVRERRDRADVETVQTLPSGRAKADAELVQRNPQEGINGDGINRTYFDPRRPVEARKPLPAVPLDDKRIHLIAYLDQTAGTMQVFRPDGAFAARISVPPTPGPAGDRVAPRRGVRLVNRRGDVKLERLRIARWNGAAPNPGDGSSRFELADGSVVSGEVAGFEADPPRLVVRDGNDERPVAVSDLVAAELSPIPDTARRTVSAILQDGTRVSGTPAAFGADALTLNSPDVADPLRVPYAETRSLSFLEKGDPSAVPAPAGRVGRLELGEFKLSGRLTDATERPGASCIAWHPAGSRTASPLRPGAAGRVVYRDPPPKATAAVVMNANVIRQVRVLGQPVRSSTVRNGVSRARPAGQPHDLHLVSGDVIPCEVTAIDDAGVHVTSPVAQKGLVPHAKVKAVELNPGTKPPNLQAAKKDRLLTVPRAQRDSPPTHLLCSRTGDLLRCRLVALNEKTIRVEVQLAEIDIPRERVAQVIWFHAGEFEDTNGVPRQNGLPLFAVEAPKPGPTHLTQVIQPNGNRVTFEAQAVSDQFIVGSSDVLGACRFDLREVDQLVFGKQIEVAVADLAYHQWRLHAAVEPLVAQDFDESGSGAGTVSPLVGQVAPEVELALLAGGRFRLSESRGQIVVLDFWASWCGPCMQTMPLTEEAMREFDPAAVRLVAVNLEEPAEHVKAVMERHKLGATVALDVDGIAGRRYQAEAIPQLVIVDREGKVARVYIGGGRNVVEQLKTTLGEMLGTPLAPAETN